MEGKMIKRFQLGKVVAMLIVFALVLSVLTIMTPTARADTEPNDDFDQAETITAGIHGGSVDVRDAVDPYDYYEITVNAGQTLSVGLVPASTLAASVSLYNPTRTQVTYEYGAKAEILNTSWTTNSQEPSYVYYILISAEQYLGAGTYGTYTMNVSLISQDDAGSGGDAGDTFGAATTIASANGTYTGFVKDDDVDDYYKLNVTAGQTLSVKVTPAITLGAELWLFDGTTMTEKAYTWGWEGEIIETSWTTNSEQPTYLFYMRVKAGSPLGAGTYGTYTVNVSLICQDDAGSEGDAGDTLATATEIATGTYSGFLKDDDVYDCYETIQNVILGQGIYITITPEETLGVELWLYDKNKNERDYAFGSMGAIARLSDSQVPETGTYYIRIKRHSEGTYSVAVSIEPTIGTPTQEPPANNVYPDEDVTVSVSVTSVHNTVSNVTLYYRTDEGIWANVSMTLNEGTGLWDGIIPGFDNCTWVSYKIQAYNDKGDYFEQDNAGGYYTYHVIPEFPQTIILPLLMIISLLAIVLGKKLQWTKTQNKELATT